MPDALVSYRALDGIAVLELHAPPANTYSYEMMLELDAAILKARMDDAVHVLVLRGAGEKFFCAGADIRMLSRVSPRFKYYFCLHANETLSRLEQTPKLVIAALNGHAVGGGLEVAMAADLRVARRDGGRIGLPEATLGVLPGTGGTQRLARLVGRAKAIELMATARTFSFDEALALGIVTHVFDAEGWWDQVMAYARTFCPPGAASRAVGAIKRSVLSGSEMAFAEALALERELQQQLFESEDAKEGLSAYAEKRPPRFKGA
ncbi:MAG TPA: enoyl-CoA hydratase-related protein [Candidatus Polarisedimenticolia bacterium]|nr:enoyl-CoA hydratase-related protein [Candidatus Polarisedimenticolia bacterium]